MRYIVCAIVALFLGYASDFAGIYVEMFNEEILETHGRLSDFAVQCKAKTEKGVFCSGEYRIPSSIVKGSTGGSIGYGVVLSATQVICLPERRVIRVFDDPHSPGKSYDTYNKYQTFDVPIVGCDSVVIRSFSKEGARRKGYAGGALVSGSFPAVSQVKRISEFFNSDIRLLITFVVFFAFFLTRFLNSAAHHRTSLNPFEIFYLPQIAFLLISSGLAQVVIPFLYPTMFARISGTFSLVAHIGPALLIVLPAISKYRDWNRVLGLMYAAAALVCFSPYFILLFGPIFLVCGLVTLSVSITRKSGVGFAFGGILLVTGLKLLNVESLPHSHMGSIFVALIVSISSARRFASAGSILKINRWGRELIKNPRSRLSPRVLGDLADMMDVGRVSVIQFQEKGECEIHIVQRRGTKREEEKFRKVATPMVFSHVYTTGDHLFHIHEDSEDSVAIRKGEKKRFDFESPLFSVLPLYSGSEVVGAIAVTNYSEGIERDEDLNHKFVASLESAALVISELITRGTRDLELNDRVAEAKVVSELSQVKTDLLSREDQTLEEPFEKAIEKICTGLSCSGFIGSLDQSTRQVKVVATSGYPSDVDRQLREGSIYALKSNLQGPIALCLNRGEIIPITDISIIADALHPLSNDLFRRNGTKSVCGIPIFLPSETGLYEREEASGIIWLESKEILGFNHASESSYKRISDSVSGIFVASETHRSKAQSLRVLNEFVPNHIRDQMIKGEAPVEYDTGYLIMIDLKKSSFVANLMKSSRIGRDFGSLVSEDLRPIVLDLANEFGLELHEIIWDAFYLTCSSKVESPEVIRRVMNFSQIIVNKIDEKYRNKILSIDPDFDFEEKLVRICITFGDITRGISPGENSKWTIVGNEMANVNKLEGIAKRLPYDIFSDSRVVSKFGFESTGEKFQARDSMIYGLRLGSSNLRKAS